MHTISVDATAMSIVDVAGDALLALAISSRYRKMVNVGVIHHACRNPVDIAAITTIREQISLCRTNSSVSILWPIRHRLSREEARSFQDNEIVSGSIHNPGTGMPETVFASRHLRHGAGWSHAVKLSGHVDLTRDSYYARPSLLLATC